MNHVRGDTMTSCPLRRLISAGVLFAALLIFGCDLVPSRPEAVFVLYRDRMKAEKLQDARKLLSEESKVLSVKLTEDFKLKEAPENLALLNVLDPVTAPLITQSETDSALLQVRTLKGGVRLVRLVRPKPDASWAIDIGGELKALKKFLGTRRALETVREQAGEYATSWRAFSDQLGRMRATEPPPPKTVSQEKKSEIREDKRTEVRTGRRPRTSAGGANRSRRRTVNRNGR
ncbi:MAG: hypothetical protein V1792_02785 [Pseudomonadota bacterium]